MGITAFLILDNRNGETSKLDRITYFAYNTGGWGECSNFPNYKIYEEENEYFFTYSDQCRNTTTIKEIVGRSVLDDVQTIIKKYGAREWNGFNKRDDSVTDGDSFSLRIQYNSGAKVDTRGTNDFPDNYWDFDKEIKMYFSRLISNFEKSEVR